LKTGIARIERVINNRQQAMPEYSFSKRKLPRGYSYPLKRGLLDELLDEAELTKIDTVHYCFDLKSDNLILRGNYSGEAHKGWAAGLSSIWLWAVRSEERKVVENVLVNEALPALIMWLRKAEQEGNVWRATSRHIDFRFRDTQLTINEW
jgi:hypothetical protein